MVPLVFVALAASCRCLIGIGASQVETLLRV